MMVTTFAAGEAIDRDIEWRIDAGDVDSVAAVIGRPVLTLATALALVGCAVGPNYKRPSAPVPAPDAYKSPAPWRVAAPQDSLPKGNWWEVFNDPELNAYEQQLLAANQSLLASKDRLEAIGGEAGIGHRRCCTTRLRYAPPDVNRSTWLQFLP